MNAIRQKGVTRNVSIRIIPDLNNLNEVIVKC